MKNAGSKDKEEMNTEQKKAKLNNMVNEELPSLVKMIQLSLKGEKLNQLSVDLINLEHFANQAFNLTYSLDWECDN